MAAVLRGLSNLYHMAFEDYIDPKTQDDFYTSWSLLLSVLTMYITIVKFIGPALMRNRLPFNLKNVLVLYNSIQIILNLYIFYESIVGYSASPNKICLNSTEKELIRTLRKHYFLLKMFDCVETVFFVLRKNFRQISFLHVYHHSMIFLGSWCGYKYYWGDSVLIVALLNSLVHAIMFVYYLLTSLDPEWKKNVSLKKSVTLIQIIQLNMMWTYFAATILIPNCEGKMHIFVTVLWIVNNLYMVTLFMKFYLKTYVGIMKKD